ncbi:GSCOCG00005216001-RA-CDS [Cotesia congregata]|nr:GSCOCG00005216001-RA-CDS [Cotesia congregata]
MYFVREALKKFVTTFLEWSHGKKLEGKSEDDVWIKDAKVKIVNGERQYEIRIKSFENDKERKSYSHCDCMIQVKTNAPDPYEMDCYVFKDGKDVLFIMIYVNLIY